MRKSIGIVLSALAWLTAVLVVVASVLYAVFAVLWLHAPLWDVLMVTLPFALVLLWLAWACNKLGISARSAESASHRRSF